MDTSSAFPESRTIQDDSGTVLKHPVIVVGIPAYNEAKYIGRALESLQSQTSSDFLAVIGDNASTDGTTELCQALAKRDPRFSVVRHDRNIGAVANFEYLRDHTDSRYFCWVGGHDILHPDYISSHLRTLDIRTDAAASFSYLRFIDESDRWLRNEHDTGTHSRWRAPMLRYLWSVAVGVDLGPIHGVFRRASMPDLPLHSCAAWDHVHLSNCIRCGAFIDVPGHLYTLRSFDERRRESTIMQRISGERSAPMDFGATIQAFLSDFDAMSVDRPEDLRWRPLLESILNDRFGSRRVRTTKWLRTLAKRVHSIRRGADLRHS